MNDKNFKGCFQLARKIFDSELWLNKPSSWFKIFIYILGKVNHSDGKTFKRGENFFNFAEEYKLIDKNITQDIIKKALVYFRRNGILSTSRSTRGVVIKVNKYNTYQDLKNYRGTKVGISEALEKHSDKQECKNEKNTSEPSSQEIKTIKGETKDTQKDEVNLVLKEFYEFNKQLNFGSSTERKAITDLLKTYGLEKLINMVKHYRLLLSTDKFMPVATTPFMFKKKLAQIQVRFNNLNK